jgi:hypothetical protein
MPGLPTDYHKVEKDFVICDKPSHPEDDEDDADTSGPSKSHRSSKEQQFARMAIIKAEPDTFEKAST